MSARHPIIAFLAGLPQFDAVTHRDAVRELRSGCVVSAASDAASRAATRFELHLHWPGDPPRTHHPVDAYKYVALQVQEAAQLGFDLKLTAQSAEAALVDASEWNGGE